MKKSLRRNRMTCTMSKPLKVLLDSTYLLPSFGVEVEGFSEEDIVKLKELLDDGAVEMYYSPIVWVEILGKIARELRRRRAGKEVLTQVSLAENYRGGCDALHPMRGISWGLLQRSST